MASIVTYESRPKLNRPILIEGLPGVGNVGKIAADFICEKLNGRRFATILSDDLPQQVLLDEECVANAVDNELWYAQVNGQDIVFLLGEAQGTTPQGQFNLSKIVFDIVLPYDPSMIVTLGGYGTGKVVNDPRILGAVSDSKLKSRMEGYGIGFYPNEPQGGIVGCAAILISFGKAYGIDSVCIMGETSGYVLDHKSSNKVIAVLGEMLGTEFDTSEMQAEIDKIDEINNQAQAAAAVNLRKRIYHISDKLNQPLILYIMAISSD